MNLKGNLKTEQVDRAGLFYNVPPSAAKILLLRLLPVLELSLYLKAGIVRFYQQVFTAGFKR